MKINFFGLLLFFCLLSTNAYSDSLMKKVARNIDAFKQMENASTEEFEKLVFTAQPHLMKSRSYKFIVTDQLGRSWLFKGSKYSAMDGAIAAYRIGILLGIPTPEIKYKTFSINGENVSGSLQRLWKGEEFKGDWASINKEGRDYILKTHLLSWLIANNHVHRGQFLVRPDPSKKLNEIIRIDNSINWPLIGNDVLTIDYRSPFINHTFDPGYLSFWNQYLYTGPRFREIEKKYTRVDVAYPDYSIDFKKCLNIAKYAELIPDNFYKSFFEEALKRNLELIINNGEESLFRWSPATVIESNKKDFMPNMLKRKADTFKDLQKFYNYVISLHGGDKKPVYNKKEFESFLDELYNEYKNGTNNHKKNLIEIAKIPNIKQMNIPFWASHSLFSIVSLNPTSFASNVKTMEAFIDQKLVELDKYEKSSKFLQEKDSIKNARNNFIKLKTYIRSPEFNNGDYLGAINNTMYFFRPTHIDNFLIKRQQQALKEK